MGLVADRFAAAYGARRMSYEPLEQTTLRAAARQVFGQNALPDFDIANAATILSFGGDWLNTWFRRCGMGGDMARSAICRRAASAAS